MHPKPIPTVDQRGSSLWFLNEGAEVFMAGIIAKFDAAFGHNAAVVCLCEQPQLVRQLMKIAKKTRTILCNNS